MMEAELRLDTHPSPLDPGASDQNLMPSEPLNVGGHATFAMRCYGFDADNPASLNVVEHKLQELESSMPLLPVGDATGWVFVSHMQHTDEQGVTTDRWVAVSPLPSLQNLSSAKTLLCLPCKNIPLQNLSSAFLAKTSWVAVSLLDAFALHRQQVQGW